MTQSTTPYEMLGGEPIVKAIVQRFYDLVEDDPAYADLRAMHEGDLDDVRKGLTGFLIGWMGGPRDWFEKGGCVMSMHRPLGITPAVTEQWIAAMVRAVDEQSITEPNLASQLKDMLSKMAVGMINRANKSAA
jgi:hemoglobin